jgi:hypothetical protein
LRHANSELVYTAQTAEQGLLASPHKATAHP